MEINKKQLVTYTIFLFILIGSVIFVVAEKPSGAGAVDVIGAYDIIEVWDYTDVDGLTDLETVDTRGYKKVNIYYKEHMGPTHDPFYDLHIAWNIAAGVGGPEEIIEDGGLYSYDVKGPYLKLYVFEEDPGDLKAITVWIYLTN